MCVFNLWFDVFLYYVWVFLLPLFFFIGIWGTKKRRLLRRLNYFYIRDRIFFYVYRLMCLYSQRVHLIYMYYFISDEFSAGLAICVLFLIAFAIKRQCFRFIYVARGACWGDNSRFCYFSRLILKLACMGCVGLLYFV